MQHILHNSHVEALAPGPDAEQTATASLTTLDQLVGVLGTQQHECDCVVAGFI